MNATKTLRRVVSAQSSMTAIAYTLASRIGVVGVNFTTGIIMARALGPAGRGATSAVSLWPLLLSSVATFGIPVALRYTVRRRGDDTAQLFSAGLALSAILGSLAAAIGLALVPRWLAHYPPEIRLFGQWMLVFTPIMSVNLLLQGYLESRGEFAKSGRMVYLAPVGTLLGLLVLSGFGAIDVRNAALAYELPFAALALGTLVQTRGALRIPRRFFARSRLLLDYGLRAYGLDVLNTLGAQIPQLLVVGLLSASSFGVYAVAVSASRTLFIIGASLNTVLFPKASELDPAAAVALVTRAARIVFAANAIAGSLLIVAMPILIRVTYGEAYAAAVLVTQILAAEAVLGGTTGTLLQAFMSTGKPGLVTLFQAIGLATAVPLMFVAVPRYGVAGAAVALLISSALRTILVLASYPVFLKHPVPRLLVTRADMRDVRDLIRRAIA